MATHSHRKSKIPTIPIMQNKYYNLEDDTDKDYANIELVSTSSIDTNTNHTKNFEMNNFEAKYQSGNNHGMSHGIGHGISHGTSHGHGYSHHGNQNHRNLALVQQSLESFTESDSSETATESQTLNTESQTATAYNTYSSAPNIKVIPIAIKQQHPGLPGHGGGLTFPAPPKTTSITDVSTASTIEDLLAEKVERIASHLEAANNNILNVDGKIKHFRNENFSKNEENYSVLNNLKSQIDHSLHQQSQVHDKLSKSIKRLDRSVASKPNQFLSSAPVILPQSNFAVTGETQSQPQPQLNRTLPGAAPRSATHGMSNLQAAAVMEDTKSFLNRIRREADERVSAAIQTAEKEQAEKDLQAESESTLARLKNFLDQQNQESNLKAQQQAMEIAAEQEKQKFFAKTQKKELDAVKKGLQNEIKLYKNEKDHLTGSLAEAKGEVKSLKFELESLKKSFDDISVSERRKFEEQSFASQSYNYKNLNEINVLKKTLERLTSERAEQENVLFNKREEHERLVSDHRDEIKRLSDNYEREIADYKNEYSSQLDQLEIRGDKSNRERESEVERYRQENSHLKRQLGLLGHELSERDLAMDQLKLVLSQAKEDLRKAAFPNEKLILSNRKFLVSISTILKDLQSEEEKRDTIAAAATDPSDPSNLLNEILKEDFLSPNSRQSSFPISNSSAATHFDMLNKYTNTILNKLAKAVERVNLAEKLKDKAEDDRSELKVKVRNLLEKIQKEKELKIEKDNMMNERAFQDTISVLQKELTRTRKQIKASKN